MDHKKIIINGNDGTGKSTLINTFDKLYNDKYFMLERGTEIPNCIDMMTHNVKLLDSLTFEYPWNRTDNNDIEDMNDFDIYRFILHLKTETIIDRINKRDKAISQWDTPTAIRYYNRRFVELAYYYGIPLMYYENKTPNEMCTEIINCIETDLYNTIRYMRLQNITHEFIRSHDIETYLLNNFDEYFSKHVETYREIIKSDFEKLGLFKMIDYNSKFNNIFVKWFMSNATKEYINYRTQIKLSYLDINLQFDINKPILIQYIQGESKIVYKIYSKFKYFDDLVLITLKPTIYSHTKQTTGEIKDLEKIRACGTMLFMEMLNRNDIDHSYLSINSNGIILSKFAECNQLEIVFKRYCEGTDKHSYFGLRKNNSIVLDTGEYMNGIYIRFDWRNPNHIINNINVNENPYYYLIETHDGKEAFFTKYLSKTNIYGVIPLGDRTINSDILETSVNVSKIKESAIKLFCTIESYLNKVGIEAKDGCFMIDSTGSYFWSEINQDCMRLKTFNSEISYDKDLWRIGGSSQSETIINKWTELNTILMKYFDLNKFHKTEIKNTISYSYMDVLNRFITNSKYNICDEYKNIYIKLLNQYTDLTRQRKVLLTLDLYDTQPVLVQKGKVIETHCKTVEEAYNKISIYPDILMVDLNGAIDKNKKVNREIIKKYAIENYIFTGGGINTIEDVQELLQSSVRRVVISSNTDIEFISKIPKSRLIIEMSINDKFEILIDGRKTNTGIHIKDKLMEVASNIEALSITFHDNEGLILGIPRDKIQELINYIPKNITRIYIAGGISNIDDIKFIWSFPRLIPQLGSAIWKNKITIGDLYCAIARWDVYGLVNCVIQHKTGIVLGVIFMDREALKLSCETRRVHRYSRQFKRVMCKGETSGNYQHIIKMSFDCDNDSLLVIIDSSKPFCHTNEQSCFSNQTVIKANMSIINEHISNCDESTSKYVSKLKKFPGFSLLKINEEFWEILSNPNVKECSDFLIHFIIYLNSIGINWDDICNELNARRWNPKLIQMRQEKINLTIKNKKLVLGITDTKYFNKTDNFILNELGIKMLKTNTGRSYKIRYEISDIDKYSKYFKDYEVYFLAMKPKDMPIMVTNSAIDGAITYNSVLSNLPEIFKQICKIVDPDIEMALIKRKKDNIDISKWTELSKCYIACEHVVSVYKFLTENLKLSNNVFSTIHVLGTSESFLVNKSKTDFLLADAIVETGTTLDENNLEIWKTIIPKGELTIGLYISKMIEL